MNQIDVHSEDSDGEDIVYLWIHSALKRRLLSTAAVGRCAQGENVLLLFHRPYFLAKVRIVN